ncbi:MAG: hypothetical protein ACKO2G_07125 [Verrucomicrobiales bacterium]
MPAPQPTNDQALVELLRLKRHETPGEDYFEDLLPRIHTRVRVEMMRQSSGSLFLERVGVFVDNLAGGRWVAGGIAAYAAALIGGLFLLQWSATPDDPSANNLQPVSLEANTPVAPEAIRVPFRFTVVPVQPLPGIPAQQTTPSVNPSREATVPAGKDGAR